MTLSCSKSDTLTHTPPQTFFQTGKVILYTDTDIAQHTPYQGFSVTGYIVNR
jgi:hypothetical protein